MNHWLAKHLKLVPFLITSYYDEEIVLIIDSNAKYYMSKHGKWHKLTHQNLDLDEYYDLEYARDMLKRLGFKSYTYFNNSKSIIVIL